MNKLALPTLLVVFASSLSFAETKGQAPGFFRQTVGELEVTALIDGIYRMDPKLIQRTKAGELQKALDKAFVSPEGGIPTSINAFLVNTGKQRILVDTGAGKCFGPDKGMVVRNLKAAGYEPSQIDLIVITHLHADHVCGVLDDEGKRLYPNAELRAAQADADFWLDEKRAAKAPAEMQGYFKFARESVAPYKAEGKFKPFAPGEKLAEGLTVEPLAGHTPGHSGYRFTSGKESVLMWGDTIHNAATQFPRLEVVLAFDIDNDAAVAKRRKVFAQAAKDKTWIAGAHLPFPGIGHLRADGKSYVWVPAQYLP